ncbi:hypothetical protein RB3365 [Rhodopirellula baltica SH 1]|uniref:Uncharacterized protein n=1 Tax=Rhodopirellula baltica (strain DSM 10527 / NCIMB 13988 / SH1) TaxID=243090 RepID=Q7UUD2_RHOBA|nr:hypothetical protein RB3365 [Rhodopirellula baltica SH 1]
MDRKAWFRKLGQESRQARPASKVTLLCPKASRVDADRALLFAP